MSKKWTLDILETIDGARPFESWYRLLSASQQTLIDWGISELLIIHGVELEGTNWLKYLGEGLSQLRLRIESKGNSEGILLRVFIHFYGLHRVLIISGYDKRKDSSRSTQRMQIEEAHKLLTEWRARNGIM